MPDRRASAGDRTRVTAQLAEAGLIVLASHSTPHLACRAAQCRRQLKRNSVASERTRRPRSLQQNPTELTLR
jgi:hypothetical protein